MPGKSMLGKSMLGKSMLGKSMLGKSMLGKSMPDKSMLGKSMPDKSMRPLIPLTRFRTFAEGLDHPEGLAFDADGTLWAGGALGQIYRIGPRGRVREISRMGGFCLGLTFSRAQELYCCKFKTPNFSVFDSEGNLYFSDSGDWEEVNGCVYRLRKNGRVEMFAGAFAFANGLSLSADERFLYVVQSTGDNVLEIEIRADGRAGKTRVYAAVL